MKRFLIAAVLGFCLCGLAQAAEFHLDCSTLDQEGYITMAIESDSTDLDEMFKDARDRIQKTAEFQNQSGCIVIYYFPIGFPEDPEFLGAWVNHKLAPDLERSVLDLVVARFEYKPCIILCGEDFRKIGWFDSNR